MSQDEVIESDVASRLDRLPWTRWHWLIIIGLGVTWILDGLEVTLVGALSGILQSPNGLRMSEAQVALSGTAYLAGNVFGALVFGYLTDRFGRKRLFFITLALYLVATALSGLAWNYQTYFLFRFLTGAGIGGEYAAINSAIDELIPARLRGTVDLIINATYWVGAVVGSGGAFLLLGTKVLPENFAWRCAFLIGAGLGLAILIIRHWVPESPRWLVTHGRADAAEKLVKSVEDTVFSETDKRPDTPIEKTKLKVRRHTPFREIWDAVFHQNLSRAILGLTLMVTQAFFYNAIFFTYGLVLKQYYQVPDADIGLYLIPFALGNVCGPLLLGRLFDSIGRKRMISLTYAGSGLLLLATAYLFRAGWLSAQTQTTAWTIIFFIASCAASSAYLTVSEIFPLEIRAMAIALFYALGTLVGGVGAPALFGLLISTRQRDPLAWGYVGAAVLMLIAAMVEMALGVKAERQSLESVAKPLSAVE